MKIVRGANPIQPGRPQQALRDETVPAAGKNRRGGAGGAAPVDRVEISEAGRALSQAASTDALQPVPKDSPDRLRLVAERIGNGAYDAASVHTEVARRMLQRGDL
jgi:hypothetical protein